MNKRKLLTLAMTLCMVAILAIGGTLAYFTDTDGATNVMTTGNVKIIQNEQERKDGKLVDFEDDHKLAPYTGSVGTNGVANEWGSALNINGTEYKMFDQSKNAIDKIVTVTNKGTESAYIRTLFAFEIPEGTEGDDIVMNRTLNLTAASPFNSYERTFKLGQDEYFVCGYVYEDALPAGETSAPSLRQIYLNANVDNEWFDAVGEDYKILALSQAVQEQGFEDADTALNTAFGDPETVEEAELVEWFSNCVEIEIEF